MLHKSWLKRLTQVVALKLLQPVQPYLTTGATDFVNSVQKGKEDEIGRAHV